VSERQAKVSQAIQRAAQLHRQGELGRAEALYTAILAAQPDHFDALNMLGVLRFQQGRDVEALDYMRAALKVRPTAVAVMSGIGLIHARLNQPAEALASYDKVLALKPDDADALNHRGNALKTLDRLDEALASYDRAIGIRPGYAAAFNNRGVVLQKLKRPGEALASYDRALALKPDDADAVNNRGIMLKELGRFDEALAHYDQALALEPDFAEAFVNRGNALKELKRFDAALGSYDQALALKPDNPEGFNNRGNLLQDLGQLDAAVASYDRALAVRPNYADARLGKSLCLLLQGDFERGWRDYEARWETEAMQPGRRDFAQRLWLGDVDVSGVTILLHGEQGFGDTLQFCRFAKQVAQRGARIVLEVQPPLRSLIATLDRSIPVIATGDAIPSFDLHCPLLSLPLALKMTPGTIPAESPYLSAPAEKTRQWSDRLGNGTTPGANRGAGLRVGLAWAGNPRPGMFDANRIDRQRSIGFDELAPLFQSTDCEFYSLQKGGDAAAQLRRSVFGPRVVDWTDELADFTDTAALIENLDLVVTVDTAVAHLAGALGKPFWLINRVNTCWRWLVDREDSPWYPTARIFRQTHHGDWSPVVERVAGELRRWCATRRAA
jgi:tetratricopeptide (TPR) repeat protein